MNAAQGVKKPLKRENPNRQLGRRKQQDKLGLAIARGLAEAQGGTLRYAPRAGGGSEFVLSLPAAELPVRILTL